MTRVVITGLGVVSPNGVGVSDFTQAIRTGKSGIRFFQEMQDLNFSCCIGGTPVVSEELKNKYFTPLQLRNFTSSGIHYGCMAGMDAWRDAGFEVNTESELDYDSGIVFGAGTSGIDKFREAIYKVDAGQVKRLGSTVIGQTMTSGISAYLGGILGFGNQVTTNSSACSTGTEAILMGFDRIQSGQAKRMLVGSCGDHGVYAWGGFDSMRVLNYKHNDRPEQGSRPMSETASGFIPGSGAGALVLETLESAEERGATILAELLGGAINSGGQRNGGTMTASNAIAAQRCIKQAMDNCTIHPNEIDVINGHLTATINDPQEVRNWSIVLNRSGKDFPYIHSLKSMIGHCLAASAAIECVAAVQQLKENFIFPSINCEDIHPEILEVIDEDCIPKQLIERDVHVIAKASLGFGDVNACLLLKKYKKE